MFKRFWRMYSIRKVTTEHTLKSLKYTTQLQLRHLLPAAPRGALPLRVIGLVFAIATHEPPLNGQATPTASTPGALFVGAGYLRANPDYSPATFTGWSVFADANLWKYVGVAAKFDHIFGPAPNPITETSYQAGLRGRVQIGPIVPFLELTGGLGSFAYLRSPQNGTYGFYAGGGGVDFSLTRKVVLRGEYDYQRWASFPPRGLQPSLVTLGVAYRLR